MPPLDDTTGAAPAAPPSIADQIAAARKAGYGDAEISSYLQQSKTWAPRFDAARKAGYSDQEIFGHLGLNVGQQQEQLPQSGANLPRAQQDEGAQPQPTATPGILGAGYRGAVQAGRDIAGGAIQTADVVAGRAPRDAATVPEQDQALAAPMDFTPTLHPDLPKAAYHLAHGLLGSAPEMGGAVAGGLAGGIATSELGPAAVLGAAGGAAIGASAISAVRSFAPIYAEELKRLKGDQNAAFTSAMKRTATEAATTGASFGAFELVPLAPFLRSVFVDGKPMEEAAVGTLTKDAATGAWHAPGQSAARMLGTQIPTQAAISASGQAAQNVLQGKAPSDGIDLNSLVGETALGLGAPALAHKAITALRGSRAAPVAGSTEQPSPPGQTTPEAIAEAELALDKLHPQPAPAPAPEAPAPIPDGIAAAAAPAETPVSSPPPVGTPRRLRKSPGQQAIDNVRAGRPATEGLQPTPPATPPTAGIAAAATAGGIAGHTPAAEPMTVQPPAPTPEALTGIVAPVTGGIAGEAAALAPHVPAAPAGGRSPQTAQENGTAPPSPESRTTEPSPYHEQLAAKLADLDARNAPDAEYRGLLSTGAKDALRRGETWRGRVQWTIDTERRLEGKAPTSVEEDVSPAAPKPATGADAERLFDEAQTLMRSLPRDMGKAKREGRWNEAQQAMVDRLDQIEQVLPQAGTEWQRVSQQRQAEAANRRAQEAATTAAQMHEALARNGLAEGDNVLLLRPAMFPGAPSTRIEGVVKLDRDGNPYVAAKGHGKLDLFSNPWKKAAADEPAAATPAPAAPVGGRPMDVQAFRDALTTSGQALRNGQWRVEHNPKIGGFQVHYTLGDQHMVWRPGKGQPNWTRERATEEAMRRAFGEQSSEPRPAAALDPHAEWWNALPVADRAQIIKAARLKWAPTSAWQHMPEATRAKLLAQRDAAGTEAKPETSPQSATPAAKAKKAPEPKPAAPAYGANNTTFTADAAERARQRIKERLNRLNAGFDPEFMLDGLVLAGFHVEAGARTFADYSRAMLADLGDGIRPYLAQFYTAVRMHPGFDTTGMDDHAAVEAELQRQAAGQQEQGDDRGTGPVSGALDQPAGGESPEGGLVSGQPAGGRPAGALAPVPPEDVRPTGKGRPGRKAGDRAGRPALPVVEGVHPGGDAADGRGGAGGEGVAPEGAGERGPQPATVRPNFHVDDPDRLIGGTPKVRFARNRAALEALAAIEEEQRAPTQAELEAMAGYIGWGSFGQDLFQGTFERQPPRQGWDAEAKWLRDHLGKQAWEAAQVSIINAHYTDPPTVKAMWDMARRMGFKGGRILEPSMGIGNFFGLMPRDIMGASDLTGIELDRTTAAMAKLLYPKAAVRQMGYQDSKTPDGFYDLVIGNWPFAKTSPPDRRYDKLSPSLHNYFFLKALDQTRPGGLVMGITSAFTMDAMDRGVRLELAKKGELVAAFRLPSGAFEKYAGTSVVTDLIVLRRRAAPPADLMAEPWINSTEMKVRGGEKINVNDWFHAHPDAVLGTLDFGHGSTYGRPSMIVNRPADLLERLEALPSRLPEGVYQPVVRGGEPRFISNNTADRQGSVVIGEDGNLYQVRGERLNRLEDIHKPMRGGSAKDQQTRDAQVRALVGMRKAYGALIDAEREGRPETEALRKALADQFQAFSKQHGPILNSKGLAVLKRVNDPAAPMLAALERPDGTLARILSEPTIRSQRRLDNPTIGDAYALARNERANLDMDRVAELAKQPRAAVERHLLASGAIFRMPGGGFEPTDSYLGGNVRRKLAEAQDALARGEDMQASVDALTKALPPTVPYFQIEAKLGATWVGDAAYKEFVAHLLGIPLDDAPIRVRFERGRWKVNFDDPRLNNTPEATTQWGHERYPFSRLVQKAMSNGTIKIYDPKDADGGPYFNLQATEEVNAKIQGVRDAFSDWAFASPERKISFEKAYNEAMNCIAKPYYDGSFMDMSGMALRRGDDPFSLRRHQINAIWRGVTLGRGLFAHEVGTGKTYTMGGIAVEGRRYGTFRKPVVFAHNANSASVAREMQEMYPGGRFLYVDNFDRANLATTLHRISNDDWDAVIMPHSVMDNMALTRETLMDLAAQEIADLEDEALEAAQAEGANLTREMMDDPEAMKKVRSPTAKSLVNQRQAIIAAIEKQANRASKEGAIPFEKLGIDAIIVDECHEFKKPPISTQMKLKGLNTDTSNRSILLNFLTGYVKKQHNGKGVYLFTGTPITNALNEVFNMSRYIMDDRLEAAGVKDWDSWFNTFAMGRTDVELNGAGEYEPVMRLDAFINTDELMRMMSEFTDVVQAKDMPEFKPRPTAEGRTENPEGRPYKKVVTDVADMSPEQRAIREDIAARIRQFKALSGREKIEVMRKKGGDPLSPLITDQEAPKAGIDARMVNPDAPDDPNSKVNRVVRGVLRHYAEPRASQVIFTDIGFNPGVAQRGRQNPFVLVNDIVAKLVAGGIPRKEIAIVAGGIDAEKKKDIADAMNAGTIRVVIGQSKTLGVGVNMQVNLRAMHHLDAPWMPGDLEQRNGRGERQGNKWNTVYEYRYVTEGVDGRRWQVLLKKDRFIKQFIGAFNNDSGKRLGSLEGEAADISDDEDIASTLSSAAGDPRIMIREKLKADVSRMERRERLHTMGQADSADAARKLRQQMQRDKGFLARQQLRAQNWNDAQERAAQAAAEAGDKRRWYEATVDGEPARTGQEIQDGLDAQVLKLRPGDKKTLATVNGHDVVADWTRPTREPIYEVRDADDGVLDRIDNATMPKILGVITALRNTVEHLPKTFADKEESARRLEEAAQQDFPQREKLNKVRQQLAKLQDDIHANPVPPPAWLRHGAPIDSDIYVDGQPRTVRGHRMDDDYKLMTDEGDVPYLQAKDENGLPIFEAHAPPAGTGKDGKVSPDAARQRPTEAFRAKAPDLAETVARDLMAAGRPEAEARAAGQLVAARYEARAAWFGGRRGTALDLFREDGAEIRGEQGSAAPGGREFDQTAYHGSPHIFDRFDISRIGTGEGNQVFGHGLYFAGRKEIAEWYRRVLSGNGLTFRGKNIINMPSEIDFSTSSVEEIALSDIAWNVTRKGKSIETAIAMQRERFSNELAELKSAPEKFSPDDIKKTKAIVKFLKSINKTDFADTRGRLYHVEIPEDHEFLSWDEIGDDQSPEVKATLTSMREKGLLPSYFGDMLGDRIYDHLIGESGEGHAGASRILRDAGIAGIRYLDNVSRANGKGTHNYVLFDDSRVAIRQYEQTARGRIVFPDTGRAIITLARDADASTFLHESGHKFLEELLDDAEHPLAPAILRQDAATVREWLGAESGPLTTEQHEQFATGFEQYLMEGVAPSPELANVFARFREWLIGIYQSLIRLGAPISDEMRGVFDRLMVHAPEDVRPAGARMPPSEAFQAKASNLAKKVDALLVRVAPGARAERADIPGAHGAYFTREAPEGLAHIIAWGMSSPDALHTVSHEAIHYLRRAGFLRPEEWQVLERTAHKQGWGERTDARYPDLDLERRTEEAIAERYADWSRGLRSNLPGPVGRIFNRLNLLRQQIGMIARRVLGKDATAEDVFARVESGEVGRRETDGEKQEGMAEQRPSAAIPVTIRQHIVASIKDTRDSLARTRDGFAHALFPMLAGSKDAQAFAARFANGLRAAMFRFGQIDRALVAQFDAAARAKMGRALDQQSVFEQSLRGLPVGERRKRVAEFDATGAGLSGLTPDQRATVMALDRISEKTWERMRDRGLVKPNADGLPYYMPRQFVMNDNGVIGRVGGPGSVITAIDPKGTNLTTAGPRRRQHLTPEESEAAAKAKLGDNTELVTDIRSLVHALSRNERAVAGRDLVDAIKGYGPDAVVEGGQPGRGYVTLDHPSMWQWRPKIEKGADGKWREATVPVVDEDGNPTLDADGNPQTKMAYERIPLHISADFAGPLRAVLSEPMPDWYRAVMKLKSGVMHGIMFSPYIHLAVELGRALPVMPGRVITGRVLSDGRRFIDARGNSPEAEWLRKSIATGGLSPIGQSWALDPVAIHEQALAEDRSTNRVWQGFKDWHQRALWDRVFRLQVGLARGVYDAAIARGLPDDVAHVVGAHVGNRYAGALPPENMSRVANMAANVALFSRSFTLGNLGVIKDMLNGAPSHTRALIEQMAGPEAAKDAQTMLRRKAVSAFTRDIGFFLAANAALQSGIAVVRNALDGDDPGDAAAAVARDYVTHVAYALDHVQDDPANLFGLLPQMWNEPGKKGRVFIGQEEGGKGIYARVPPGKVGEEFIGWFLHPGEMAMNKLSPMVRPFVELMTNRDSLDRQIMKPNPESLGDWLTAAGQAAAHIVTSQLPVGAISGAWNLAHEGYAAATGHPTMTGQQDAVEAAKVLGPATGLAQISTGHPLGPQAGFEAAGVRQHEWVVQTVVPQARRMIQAGDEDGARAAMSRAGLTEREIGHVVANVNAQQRAQVRADRRFGRIAGAEGRDRAALTTGAGGS